LIEALTLPCAFVSVIVTVYGPCVAWFVIVHDPADKSEIAAGTYVDGEDVTTHVALRLVTFVSDQVRVAVDPPPPPVATTKL
jgi:hypothetical protein